MLAHLKTLIQLLGSSSFAAFPVVVGSLLAHLVNGQYGGGLGLS